MAIHAAQPLDGSMCLQAVSQDRNALGIAAAAALELDIENVAIDQIKADLRGANTLGLVSLVLIHFTSFLSGF